MKVNKTNTLAFIAISIMIVGGAYTLNFVSNTGNGVNIQYLPNNAVDSVFNIPKLVNNPQIDRVDPALSQWMSTGIQPEHMNTKGGKTSVLFFTAGDPTLNGAISPKGYFKLGSSSIYFVQALVDGVGHLRSLVDNTNVLRMVADFSSKNSYKTPDLYESLINLDQIRQPESVSDVGQVPESFRTREILNVANGQSISGLGANLNGSGVTVNVHDTGVDYGHAALQGVLATKTDGSSAAFDGTGDYWSVTNQYSAEWYADEGNQTKADIFNGSITPTNGMIDLTGYGDYVIYSHYYGPGFTLSDIWTGAAFGQKWGKLFSSYNVTGVPGAANGVFWGLSWVRTGNMHMMVPFISVDTGADDGVYDRIYHDWDTAFNFAKLQYKQINQTQFEAAVKYSFADEAVAGTYNDVSKPYLASDFLLADGKTAGSDGFPELSIGAFGNSYDIHDNDWDGNSNEVVNSIHSGGMGYVFMSDYDTHGTGVAGSIAAQDVQYSMYSNVTDPNRSTFSIQGVAPGAKIMATAGLLTTSGDIWAYLWATGFEPVSTGVNAGNWTQSGDHIANISSNSWGFLSFYGSFGDDQVHGFDLYSMFMELLATPGVLSGSPGITFVISAGNTGNGYGTMGSPEPLSGILVGASTNSWWRANASADDLWANDSQGQDEIIGFSSAGPTTYNYPKVDVVNVGAFDYSTAPTDPIYHADYGDSQGTNNSYQLFGGTSQAAPYTSAVLAYIFQAYYDDKGTVMTSGEAKTYLKSGATDLGYDVYRQGAGRADIAGSVAIVYDDSTNNLVSSTAFPTVYVNRLNSVMASYFGEDYWYGISDSMQTAYTSGQADTAVAFGSLRTSSGTSAQSLTTTVSGTTVSGDWYDAKTYSSTTPTYASEGYYTYHNLADNFTLASLTSADYVQFVLSVDQDAYWDARDNGADFRVWVVNAPDDDGDGVVDDTERELLTYGYNSYHQVLITVGASQLTADTYLAVRDGTEDYGSDYTLTAIAYTRTDDPAITTSTSVNTHTVTVNPTGLKPGFYTGFITFTNGGMAQYSYSIAFEASDYDTTHSLAEATGNNFGSRTTAFDNNMIGSVSLTGRRQSGDWRFVDIFAGGTNGETNTLAVEVNWTSPGTVLDAYLYTYNGTVLAHSNPIFAGAGAWDSYASAGPTRTRLIADVTGYDFGSTGAWYTLALHHVISNSSLATPVETFTFGAAFLDADASSFKQNGSFIRTGTLADSNAGNPVTENLAGLSWVSASGGNPIPRFGPEGLPSTLSISQFTSLSYLDVEVASPVVDGGTFSSLLFSYDMFLTAGMTIDGTLGWSDDSDLDLVLVPKGIAPDFDSDICGTAASSANPERLRCSIDETGTYVLAAIYYDGSGAAFTYDLEVFAKASVVDTASLTSSAISLSLVTEGVADATYLLTATGSGFNGGNETSLAFTFDSVGPAVSGYPSVEEHLGTTVVIGEVYDAGDFDLTIMKGTTTVFDESLDAGNNQIVIASTHITGYNEDNTFTYTAVDEFGHTSSGSIVIFRDDATPPSFTPLADIEVKQKKEFTLTWTVTDSSGGTYRVLIGGVNQPDLAGTWVPGAVSLTTSFADKGEYFLKMEFTDKGGNIVSDQVKITVKKSSSDDGFLPFNLMFMLVAIPVLVALKKKSNK